MTPSLPELIERLERLAKGATPGPWPMERNVNEFVIALGAWSLGQTIAIIPTDSHNSSANAQFIAACDPQTILTLCKALKASVAREKALHDALTPIHKFLDRASKRHIGRRWSDLAKEQRILAVWLAEMTPQSTPDCTMAELFEMHERASAALKSRASKEAT